MSFAPRHLQRLVLQESHCHTIDMLTNQKDIYNNKLHNSSNKMNLKCLCAVIQLLSVSPLPISLESSLHLLLLQSLLLLLHPLLLLPQLLLFTKTNPEGEGRTCQDSASNLECVLFFLNVVLIDL